MSKIILVSSLVAACWLTLAAPQTAPDSPGVTVSLNGASLLHRTGVGYPPAALRNGVQGAVTVQVKLDSSGTVNDAQVLSGPEALRKAALESILNWHFSQAEAGATREVQIAFELPKSTATATSAAATQSTVQTGVIRSIHVSGISPQASAELLASLPLREGGEWNADSAQKASQAVRAFDEHLTIRPSSTMQGPGSAPQVDLTISTAGRIKVGGNVQSAMIEKKATPVYPAAAKAAGVQGIVHLAAVIGSDGAVQEVNVLDGPPELQQAAMDAVKQWVYRPTLLNGDPVQVQTTIDINFTLNP